MQRSVHDEGDEDDDWDDDFDTTDDDEIDNDEAETIPCLHCGGEIYEDAPRCPHCQRYISAEDAPPRRKSWFILIGAAICLYIVYRWITG